MPGGGLLRGYSVALLCRSTGATQRHASGAILEQTVQAARRATEAEWWRRLQRGGGGKVKGAGDVAAEEAREDIAEIVMERVGRDRRLRASAEPLHFCRSCVSVGGAELPLSRAYREDAYTVQGRELRVGVCAECARAFAQYGTD